MIYFLIIQHGLYPLLRSSAPLPCYAVDLVPLTFELLRIISSHDLKNKKINIRL
jgi:hypothetical protein